MEQVGKILKEKYGKGSRSLVCTALTSGKEFYSQKVTSEILSFLDPRLEYIDLFLCIKKNWFTDWLNIIKFLYSHEEILSQILENVNQLEENVEKKW